MPAKKHPWTLDQIEQAISKIREGDQRKVVEKLIALVNTIYVDMHKVIGDQADYIAHWGEHHDSDPV